MLITPAVMAYNYCLGSADGVIDALDRLSWSSLDPEQVRLYWVYAVCVPCFAGYVLFSINRELQQAVSLRSSLIQKGSRGTDRRPPRFFVAVTGIAPDLQYERGLRSYYHQWESHICTVTFVGGSFKRKLTARRNQLIRSIERCEVAFIFDEMKECAGEKISIQHRVRERVRNRYSRSLSQDRGFSRQLSQAISQWAPYNLQPVEWQYRSLGIINHAIRQQRENSPGSASSAILEIDDYLIARALVAAKTSVDTPFSSLQYLGTCRSHIIPSNIRNPLHLLHIRRGTIDLTILGLTTLWTLPVGANGFVSQLNAGLYLIQRSLTLPSWLLGPLQGVVPQLVTSTLMNCFPYLLRHLIGWKQYPTVEDYHLTFQSFYFHFLFIQLFIVTSVSSGLIPSLVVVVKRGITEVPCLLAQNLPLASNYFLSFVVLQATSSVISTIFRSSAWFQLCAAPMDKLRTPRDLVNRIYETHDQIDWETVYPTYSTIANIGAVSCLLSRAED